MSDLSWPTRLHHVRFSRLILFLEKWASIYIVCVLFLLGYSPTIAAACALFLFVAYALVHAGHYLLEESAGLPVNRWTFRF